MPTLARSATSGVSRRRSTQHITGLGTIEGRMLVLVDIEKLLGSADGMLCDSMNVE